MLEVKVTYITGSVEVFRAIDEPTLLDNGVVIIPLEDNQFVTISAVSYRKIEEKPVAE